MRAVAALFFLIVPFIVCMTGCAVPAPMRIVLRKTSPQAYVVPTDGWKELPDEKTSFYHMRQFTSSSGSLTIYTFLKAPAELNILAGKLISENSEQNRIAGIDALLVALEKQYDKGYLETLEPQSRASYAKYTDTKGATPIESATIETIKGSAAAMGYQKEERAECIDNGFEKERALVNYNVYSIVVPGSGSHIYELRYRTKERSSKASDMVADLLRKVEVDP
jgi:hypothetical protein